MTRPAIDQTSRSQGGVQNASLYNAYNHPELKPELRLNKITGTVQGPADYETELILARPVGHSIPLQLLQHLSDESAQLLPVEEQEVRGRLGPAPKSNTGVVVSAGKMDRTVKVRMVGKKWNNKVKKHFDTHTDYLVHDPNNSLLAGDVVVIDRLRCSKEVYHIVTKLHAPFGTPAHERPPIPTPDQRLANWKKERFAKIQRRALRRAAARGDEKAINELKVLGLDPGAGVEAGEGRNEDLQEGVGKERTPSKGAILGSQGQKLPEGVLPGGEQAVGKINERAKHNKEMAMKLDAKAEDNLLEAKEKAEALEKKGVSADPLSGTTLERGRLD
ncbi:nucleic acid-binding protein [Teratosphaeria nubilosa]|uniref:Nucleic acid-binding protein n=1 Tax=Teratosphaeria nubilosa TaxID=161662 RepID=A0A6G1LI07_9PEZI|nr:nucleic acid-binding protein [Teratosphaeria nubilosa]